MNLNKLLFFNVKIVLFAAFIYLNAGSVHAQNPISKNYKIENGLPSNETHFTFSDSKGFLWVATDYGLSRFDGFNFKTFTLAEGMPEAMILKIYEDQKGRIWFISLSSYVGYIENDRIFNIDYQFKNKVDQPNSENFAYSIHVDKQQTLWIGTIHSGLIFKLPYPYTKEPQKRSMQSDFVYEFDKQGNYIFGTYTKITKGDQIPKKCTFKYIQRWSGKTKSSNFDFIHFNQRTRIIKINPDYFLIIGLRIAMVVKNGKVSPFLENSITFSEVDKHGQLWIGTIEDGLFCFPSVYELKNPKTYFKEEYFTWLTTDHEGGYWLSNLNNGLVYVPEFDFKQILNSAGKQMNSIYALNNNELFVNKLQGNIIHLREDQIIREYPVKAYNFNFYQKKSCLYYFALLDKGENNSGNYIDFSAKTPQIKINNFAKNQTVLFSNLKVYKENQGKLYGGMNYIVYLYDEAKDHFSELLTTKYRFNDFWIDSTENIWFATNEGLISYAISSKKWTFWNSKFKELSQRIDLIVEQKNGNLILAVKGYGLLIFDKKKKFIKIDKTKGLNSNFIRKIYLDEQNNAWLASNLGLCKIDLNKGNKITNYFYLNSFNIGNINDVMRVGNQLYLTTSNGLYKLSLSKLNQNHFKSKLPLFIHKVSTLNSKKVAEKEVLNYTKNYIRFDYSAISFSHSKNFSYYYRIQELDDKWHQTKNTSVEYNQLPSGNYTFLVQAKSSTASSPVSIASFPFTISTPYWEQWWFISICVCSFLLTVYLIVRLRIKVISKRELERSQLRISIVELKAKALRSQMNPHFLFNSLNSIQSYILLNESKIATHYLGKFSKLMRSILESSQHESILVEDEIDLLTTYIELEKMRFNDSFDFELSYERESGILQRHIPVMLVQPFVENSILHGLKGLGAKKGELSIRFELTGDCIRCLVKDNGIGRVASGQINQKKRHYHQSISSSLSYDRIALYNTVYGTDAKIELKDLYDEHNKSIGTEVIIYIPIFKTL